jgi:uncharacterized protein YdaU (DUF1376 family)
MSLPYYRWFPGKYALKTRFLSWTQDCAYRRLIEEYMSTGPLPNDMPRVHLLIGAHTVEEKAAVEFILTEFFRLAGPKWYHEHCETEIKFLATLSANGRAAVETRWANNREQKRAKGEQSLSDHDVSVDTPVLRPNNGRKLGVLPQETRDKRQVKPTLERFVVPDWVDQETWEAWEQMRVKIRKPLTDKARRLNLTKLAELRSQGQNPNAIIDQSTANGWAGFYAYKDEKIGSPTNRDPFADGI